MEEKNDEVCYVGGIAEIRGIKEIVKAMKYTNGIELSLAEFSEKMLKKKVCNE